MGVWPSPVYGACLENKRRLIPARGFKSYRSRHMPRQRNWIAQQISQLNFIMILNSKQKGNLTELQCLAAFGQYGYTISIPYGDCARYDFIVDINNKLYRIQCKTSQEKENGVFSFSCRSTTGNTLKSHSRSYNEEQIDFFATVIQDKCCLIPVNETGGNQKTLRLLPPKTNQKVGISYVKDYLLEVQLAKLIEE